jgi:hypothetical protein
VVTGTDVWTGTVTGTVVLDWAQVTFGTSQVSGTTTTLGTVTDVVDWTGTTMGTSCWTQVVVMVGT